MSDTAEIRRANLIKLAAKGTSKSAFARLAGISPAQLRQIVNGDEQGVTVRDCGEKLARKIEGSLGLEKGWLDQIHPDDLNPQLVMLLRRDVPETAALAAATSAETVSVAGLSPMQRATVDALLKICRNGEMSDRGCIELLEAWKEKLD
jgi:hypothetical protein